MNIYKTRLFAKWAQKEQLPDKQLKQAVWEIEKGLVDADLGGNVYKKRVALKGRGKRGGALTLIAYRAANKAFFIFGYAKKEKDNITTDERKLVQVFASELLSYSSDQLSKLVKDGNLFEVDYED